MDAKAQSLYLQTQVNTATPQELTLLLYNGCIRFMKQALFAIEQKDITAKHENIVRAQAIVNEFLVTLDMKYEISKDLRKHYEFVMQQLMNADVKMDSDALRFCIDHITELRDTWAQAMKLARTQAKVSI